MLEVVDENVGRLVETLNELGQLDNTLIVYLSDNGAASHVADIMNKPYYGCKSLLWEGGLKTHCIVRWPGVTPVGAITDSIGWVGDLLPTFLDVVGGSYPAEFRGTRTAPPDGRSILPVLKGETLPPPETLFFNDKGQQAVVYQGRWKLLIEPGNYNMTSKVPGTAVELYDLENDPLETKNLAEQHPERVAHLTGLCEEWQKKNGLIDYSRILNVRPDHTR
jgi:arylsulfatase A-like enzyme